MKRQNHLDLVLLHFVPTCTYLSTLVNTQKPLYYPLTIVRIMARPKKKIVLEDRSAPSSPSTPQSSSTNASNTSPSLVPAGTSIPSAPSDSRPFSSYPPASQVISEPPSISGHDANRNRTSPSTPESIRVSDASNLVLNSDELARILRAFSSTLTLPSASLQNMQTSEGKQVIRGKLGT